MGDPIVDRVLGFTLLFQVDNQVLQHALKPLITINFLNANVINQALDWNELCVVSNVLAI